MFPELWAASTVLSSLIPLGRSPGEVESVVTGITKHAVSPLSSP